MKKTGPVKSTPLKTGKDLKKGWGITPSNMPPLPILLGIGAFAAGLFIFLLWLGWKEEEIPAPDATEQGPAGRPKARESNEPRQEKSRDPFKITDPPPIQFEHPITTISTEELTFFSTLKGKRHVALTPKKKADSKLKIAVKPGEKPQIKQSQTKPPPGLKPTKKPLSRGTYTIQVASFPAAQDAENFARRLKEKGYDAYVVTGEVPQKGTWYRVRIGHYPDRATAQQSATPLSASEKLGYLITPEG